MRIPAVVLLEVVAEPALFFQEVDGVVHVLIYMEYGKRRVSVLTDVHQFCTDMTALVEVLTDEAKRIRLGNIGIEKDIRDRSLGIYVKERQRLVIEDRRDEQPIRFRSVGLFSSQVIGIFVEHVEEERLHGHAVLPPFSFRLLNALSHKFPI